MANEKRLIDAIEHHSRVSKVQMTDLFPDWKEFPQDVKEKLTKLGKKHEQLLFDAPTVDAVEVVLCKKCLYSSQYADKNGMYKCGGILTEDGDCFLMVKPDHFCAFGELRGKKMDGGDKNG